MAIPILILILGLGITYFLILSVVKTAIEESTNHIKDAVTEGILEALALRDAREKANKIDEI